MVFGSDKHYGFIYDIKVLICLLLFLRKWRAVLYTGKEKASLIFYYVADHVGAPWCCTVSLASCSTRKQ